MFLAIVGSRTFTDLALMDDVIAGIERDQHITAIVSGGARGADSLAEAVADEAGIDLVVYHADWDRFGKSAGYKRNQQIVADADRLVAFFGPDGITKGTKHSIDLAYQKGIPIDIYFQGRPDQDRHHAGKES